MASDEYQRLKYVLFTPLLDGIVAYFQSEMLNTNEAPMTRLVTSDSASVAILKIRRMNKFALYFLDGFKCFKKRGSLKP